MDISLLKIFLCVSQEKSLTEAAKRLHTVQSNISARLRLLEEELGQPLFIRSKKGMVLTEVGERLRPMAADIVQKTADIKTSLQIKAPIGNITLGMPESFLRAYLKRPLEKWIKDHPGSIIRLKTGNSSQTMADLETRELDIGVIAERFAPPQFHILKEFKSEAIIVAPKFVRELERNYLLDLQPMTLEDSQFFGQMLAGFCGGLNLGDRSLEYRHSIETILHGVSAGFGYSVMPKCLLVNHPMKNNVSIHKLSGKSHFSYFKICLASRKGSSLMNEMAKYV